MEDKRLARIPSEDKLDKIIELGTTIEAIEYHLEELRYLLSKLDRRIDGYTIVANEGLKYLEKLVGRDILDAAIDDFHCNTTKN